MILSSRIETPIGPLVLLAREGILLMLEFEDAEPRIEREMKARFRGEDHQPTEDPFGFASRINGYFSGDIQAVDIREP